MAKYTVLSKLLEGGWATTVTQQTKITPVTVREVLEIMALLTQEFNQWLRHHDHAPGVVELGSPTGSGYYHKQDPDHKEYGDVDLQMIAPNPWGHSHSTYSSEWNHLWDEWVARHQPPQVNLTHSTPGHPILEMQDGGLVQVDFMWHQPAHAEWGLARSVPPRGIKGLLNGNMFSVLGSMLNMSLQHSGAQVKVDAQGESVPFSKKKGVTLKTITHDPHHLFLDLLSYLLKKPMSQLKIPHLLTHAPGVQWPNPDIKVLIHGIQGLAQAITLNQGWAKHELKSYASEQEFKNEFWRQYEAKALQEINNPKRLKAETPTAQARAQRDMASIQQGLLMVKKIWQAPTD
jgi:hypothetical protein